MRIRRLAAALVVVAGATPAGAATPPFPGAGYVVHGANSLTTSFTVPELKCAAHENSDLIIGIMATDVDSGLGWNGGASLSCHNGTSAYGMQVWIAGCAIGIGTTPANAGDRIQVKLRHATHRRPLLSATDLTNHDATGGTLCGPPGRAASGAFSSTRVPRFRPITVRTSGDDGRPLAELAVKRHFEWRARTKLIGTSKPSSDKYHFVLYFRHA